MSAQPVGFKKCILCQLAGLLFGAPFVGAMAQTGVPDTGTLLQQIPPPSKAVSPSLIPGLTIEGADGQAAQLPESISFEVSRILITRNTIFDDASLRPLVAHAEGKSISLQELGKLASLITDYYQSRGYPVTRAMIPAQTITDGVVRIEVLEATLGEVTLDNSSRVRDALLLSTLKTLKKGDDIAQVPIDHVLLLLSDIPGVTVKATLKPGQATGTSDLVVATQGLPALSGDWVLDNHGNDATGHARVIATLTYNNLLHQGDTVNVTALSSGRGLNYGRLAYEAVLNGRGSRIGTAVSELQYSLSGADGVSQLYGNAQVQSLWARQALVRSENNNVYGQILWENLQTGDPSIAKNQQDRSLQNASVILSGDAREAFFARGISSWSASLTRGQVRFNAATDRLTDAATAGTQGSFTKFNLNLAHLQAWGRKDSLYLTYAGQWANNNLDPSQKRAVGGATSVRAYRSGVVSGDLAHVLTAEWRHELAQAGGGQWRALAFVDTARVSVNKRLWAEATGANEATLSGAGLGLDWTGAGQWTARGTMAYPLGATPALLSDPASLRAWLELRKVF